MSSTNGLGARGAQLSASNTKVARPDTPSYAMGDGGHRSASVGGGATGSSAATPVAASVSARPQPLFSQSRLINRLNLLNFRAALAKYRGPQSGNRPGSASLSADNHLLSIAVARGGGGDRAAASSHGADDGDPDNDDDDDDDDGDELSRDAKFVLHSYNFHDQLWTALARNPLSTIYSLAWTVCYSLPTFGAEHTSDETYYGNWFAMSLLHRYVDRIYQLVLHEKNIQEVATPRSAGRSPGSTAAADFHNDIEPLFTLEQLRAADERLTAYWAEYIAAKDDRDTLRRLHERDETAYLVSPAFERRCDATPFGSIERVLDTEDPRDAAGRPAHADGRSATSAWPSSSPQTDNDGRRGTAARVVRWRYVDRTRDLRDPRKLLNSFRRAQAYEPIREQAEAILRRTYPAYHARYGVHLDAWTLTALDSREERAAFGRFTAARLDAAARSPSYVMYWQLQKSELVWTLVHVLFALNEVVRDDALAEDLLFFVVDHLDKLIECGMCHTHWLHRGRREWRKHNEWFELFREILQEEEQQQHHSGSGSAAGGSAATGTLAATATGARPVSTVAGMSVYARYLLNRTNVAFDELMLRTHNDITGDNVEPRKRLTDATIDALRLDYLLFALSLSSCVTFELDSMERSAASSPSSAWAPRSAFAAAASSSSPSTGRGRSSAADANRVGPSSASTTAVAGTVAARSSSVNNEIYELDARRIDATDSNETMFSVDLATVVAGRPDTASDFMLRFCAPASNTPPTLRAAATEQDKLARRMVSRKQCALLDQVMRLNMLVHGIPF